MSQIIGEKISSIYHLTSYPDTALAIILEFENGNRCFMNGYNIEIDDVDRENSNLMPIKFNSPIEVENCFLNQKIIDIRERDEDGWKYITIENGYDIGVINSIFKKYFYIGMNIWMP